MEEDDSNNATDKWVDARCIVNDRFTQDQLFLFKNSLKKPPPPPACDSFSMETCLSHYPRCMWVPDYSDSDGGHCITKA